jgi:hypothetical protein
MQTMGDQGMGVFIEHGDILFYVCFPLPVGEGLMASGRRDFPSP